MEFKILQKTPLYDAFSDLAKRIFLPDGIFYWSGRAKKEAEIVGTIGSAFAYEKDFVGDGSEEWLPCYIEDIKKFTTLTVRDLVPYSSIGGLTGIREIWKDWIVKKSNYDENDDKEELSRLKEGITDPITTGGITNAIYLSCSMFLNPGEQIISPNKRWGNYDNIIVRNLGAKIKSFDYFKGKKINLEGLEQSIGEVADQQNKIVMILNFPNNPTGYIPTEQEATEIIETLQRTQKSLNMPFIVLVDDAYEPYIYSEEVLNRSLFYNLHQLDDDIIPIKLDGISKEFLMYGGRIGFVTIGLKPKWVNDSTELETLKSEINNKLEGLNRSSISNCNSFYQSLTKKLFEEVGIEKIIEKRNKIISLLKNRYDKINQEFTKIEDPNISVDPNSGGFFLFVNLNPEKIKATEFADHLLKKYKIGVIPSEKPAENINGIRIAYCSIDVDKIPEFVNRIKQALKDF
ncbi:MAG: aminotransferase class I/II-fold pyridoxal phosphate-dependent enzyme [Candidatus Lokiarchaeota archaeon]|nr:aminotransferase class I/II-fold pyridoxal phosphate-dependent enzyme [Candidatus Lokiarchaeota archaeon]MBD3340139.1 aminotransferase class I/II-fold pyridoxal phosphate-dependent enzyme [Candidatus Lokiarchaeota archaeon]